MEAKVIKVLDDGMSVVLNKGAEDGLTEGMRFRLIERTEEKLYDPDTDEFLGFLEIPKGIGEVTFVQDKYSFLESGNFEYEEQEGLRLGGLFMQSLTSTRRVKKRLPFKNPKEGDVAVLISG